MPDLEWKCLMDMISDYCLHPTSLEAIGTLEAAVQSNPAYEDLVQVWLLDFRPPYRSECVMTSLDYCLLDIYRTIPHIALMHKAATVLTLRHAGNIQDYVYGETRMLDIEFEPDDLCNSIEGDSNHLLADAQAYTDEFCRALHKLKCMMFEMLYSASIESEENYQRITTISYLADSIEQWIKEVSLAYFTPVSDSE